MVIRHKREKAGLSARALSLQAGLSASYVSKVEAGEIEPSLKAFALLSVILGFNKEEVYMIIRWLGDTS